MRGFKTCPKVVVAMVVMVFHKSEMEWKLPVVTGEREGSEDPVFYVLKYS